MRESCSCGAAIHTLSYTRALQWRFTHQHGATEHIDLDGTEGTYPIGFTIPDNDAEDDETE